MLPNSIFHASFSDGSLSLRDGAEIADFGSLSDAVIGSFAGSLLRMGCESIWNGEVAYNDDESTRLLAVFARGMLSTSKHRVYRMSIHNFFLLIPCVVVCLVSSCLTSRGPPSMHFYTVADVGHATYDSCIRPSTRLDVSTQRGMYMHGC
jgi:hypothetical protein